MGPSFGSGCLLHGARPLPGGGGNRLEVGEWGESWERFVPKMVEIWRRIHEDLKVNSDDDSIRFFLVFFFWLEFSSFFLSPIYWELWYSRGWKFQDKHHALQQAKVMPIPKWQEIWNKNNRFQVWKNQGSIKMFMIVSGFLCRILSKKKGLEILNRNVKQSCLDGYIWCRHNKNPLDFINVFFESFQSVSKMRSLK